MASKKTKRIQVPVTAALERKLILWAHIRNESSVPSWIKTVLTLRVDNAWDKIQSSLQEQADHLEIPVKDLERRVLSKYGFDFGRELEELDDGVSDE